MDISQHLPTYPNASQQPNNAVAVVKGLKLPQFFFVKPRQAWALAAVLPSSSLVAEMAPSGLEAQ